jgi:hypothetical protein
MPQPPDTVRLIRIFVSSPGDVSAEREVLGEVVQRINGTQGEAHGVRLELWQWERNVVPQLGPPAQTVVDAQTLPYDIYLGIMSGRFGTPTETHGSGTEKEFRDAVKRWGDVGSPWILFYFQDNPALSSKPAGRTAVPEGLRVSRGAAEARDRGRLQRRPRQQRSLLRAGRAAPATSHPESPSTPRASSVAHTADKGRPIALGASDRASVLSRMAPTPVRLPRPRASPQGGTCRPVEQRLRPAYDAGGARGAEGAAP